jgi:hypothetical protein
LSVLKSQTIYQVAEKDDLAADEADKHRYGESNYFQSTFIGVDPRPSIFNALPQPAMERPALMCER